MGKLFRARGYDVRHTGGSGDQGGDLILRKDGEITVVQCKAWKNPATPQVARELGGSMMYYKADNGMWVKLALYCGDQAKECSVAAKAGKVLSPQWKEFEVNSPITHLFYHRLPVSARVIHGLVSLVPAG